MSFGQHNFDAEAAICFVCWTEEMVFSAPNTFEKKKISGCSFFVSRGRPGVNQQANPQYTVK